MIASYSSKTMASSLQTLTSAAEPQSSGHFQFEPGPNKDISLCLQDQEYTENVKEVQVYLDKVCPISILGSCGQVLQRDKLVSSVMFSILEVRKIVRPGCSQELLNIALSSMSSLVGILSVMSSEPKPRASL
ncbi:hypothetical protein RHMOL_Rhmol07G0051500 [Rhododendron molle]|uniref:Uncharacterized protein n=1 Tax=Rhododendron molle TaxID=49168 RepID=A0ACC0MZ71_RHOML|nr:hypothetical protein RHMOL_Rhmol07G0051500 [Rhododendron molle]